MRTVYVLMYEAETKDGPEMRPYAVFEDSITAEKMKRDGDEIVKVPFFEDPTERLVQAVERYKTEEIPLTDNHTTWTQNPWSRDSTLAPFPPPNYPKVTCNKTVDEHSWTNRSD